MTKSHLIPIADICSVHQVEIRWMEKLKDYGLVRIIVEAETLYLPEEELKNLERILMFKNELGINLAGIETIIQLLERLELAQQRVATLENQLKRFQ